MLGKYFPIPLSAVFLCFFCGCYISLSDTPPLVYNSVGTPTLTSVNISNNLLVLQGNNLHKVTNVTLQNNNTSIPFILNTQNLNNLSAGAAQGLALSAGQTYTLILTNPNGDTAFEVQVVAKLPDPFFTGPSYYYTAVNNAGIGVSSPRERLDVGGDIRIGGQATSYYGVAVPQAMLSLYNYNYGIAKFTDTLTVPLGVRVFTNTGTNLQFGVVTPSTFWPYSGGGTPYGVTESNFKPKLTIDTNGLVGIGTTTPSYQLEVNGNGRIGNFAFGNSIDYHIINDALTGTTSNSYALYQNAAGNTKLNSAAGEPLDLQINTLSKLHINGSNGYVGIGTTTPLHTLDIVGDISTDTGSITNAKSLWVGVTSSTYTMDVAGTGQMNNILTLGGSTAVGAVAAGTYIYLANTDKNHFIEETGPSGSPGNQMYFGEYGGNFHFLNTSTSIEPVTITGGFVGIGTTSPVCPLEIQGTATINQASTEAYLKATGAVGTAIPGSQAYSIVASGRINASEIDISSDRRLKTEITDIPDETASLFIKQARPVHFKWKNNGTSASGFIAQEVDKIGVPGLMVLAPERKMKSTSDDDGYVSPDGARLTLSYNQLTTLLTKEVQNIHTELPLIRQETTEIKNALCHTTPALAKSLICNGLGL